jgi:hypothetical protein
MGDWRSIKRSLLRMTGTGPVGTWKWRMNEMMDRIAKGPEDVKIFQGASVCSKVHKFRKKLGAGYFLAGVISPLHS